MRRLMNELQRLANLGIRKRAEPSVGFATVSSAARDVRANCMNKKDVGQPVRNGFRARQLRCCLRCDKLKRGLQPLNIRTDLGCEMDHRRQAVEQRVAPAIFKFETSPDRRCRRSAATKLAN